MSKSSSGFTKSEIEELSSVFKTDKGLNRYLNLMKDSFIECIYDRIRFEGSTEYESDIKALKDFDVSRIDLGADNNDCEIPNVYWEAIKYTKYVIKYVLDKEDLALLAYDLRQNDWGTWVISYKNGYYSSGEAYIQVKVSRNFIIENGKLKPSSHKIIMSLCSCH